MIVFISVWINFENRLNKWLTLLLCAVSYAGMMAITWMLPILTLIRTVIGWVYVIIVVELLLKGSWVFKLVAASASILAMMMSDLILGAMIGRNAYVAGTLMQNHTVAAYTVLLFINLVLQSITVVFIRMIRRRSIMTGRGRWSSALLLGFPISQLAAIWLYFMAYIDLKNDFNPWMLVTVIAIFMLADAALIFSLRMAERSVRTQARNDMLEEQAAFQKDYYAELGTSYEQIRKMRHDIDNHLYTIQALLASSRTEDASDYVRELTSDDSARVRFPVCENTVVASFLEKKEKNFEKAGIDFECEISMPSDTGVSNPDLICSIGNILDNAREACEGIDQPVVVLNVNYRRPYLSIQCDNSAVKNAKPHNKRIPELDRGLGLKILEDLADQYDGEFRTEPGDGRFRTVLVLKGDMKNA